MKQQKWNETTIILKLYTIKISKIRIKIITCYQSRSGTNNLAKHHAQQKKIPC